MIAEDRGLYYKRVKTESKDNRIFYQAFEGEQMAAEFSWHLESPARGHARFWIDDIRLAESCENRRIMDLVLHFIQYKCLVSGCGAMYVRIHLKNLFYQDLYKKFGFFTIAQRETASSSGDSRPEGVLKYVLPDSRETEFQNYIRRQR